MTTRSPCSPSVRSVTSLMPWSRLDFTSSAIFSMTRSGPTPYGSSVTTIPRRRAVTVSTLVAARIRNVPRPVSYASRIPSSPTILPPVGRSGPGTNRMTSSRVAFG